MSIRRRKIDHYITDEWICDQRSISDFGIFKFKRNHFRSIIDRKVVAVGNTPGQACLCEAGQTSIKDMVYIRPNMNPAFAQIYRVGSQSSIRNSCDNRISDFIHRTVDGIQNWCAANCHIAIAIKFEYNWSVCTDTK